MQERQQGAPNKAPFAVPSIGLPKGGGAIRGIGEKFDTNPVTGTGSMTVPIPTSVSRSELGPNLSLSYDSGAGNGPFGFGWTLSVPAISRKTDKGLPRYCDADESDVFLLSGAEDLVPVLDASGVRFVDETTDPRYTIHRYRPRIENAFARVERWTERVTRDVHWRSISRDNVTSFYGKDDHARISDPDPPGTTPRVFSWLLCESRDDKGNAIVYDYAAEDDARADRTQAHERNRVRTANRYLKRIRYGNRVSHLADPDFAGKGWMFDVVFDYGDGHVAELPLDPAVPRTDQHRRFRVAARPTGSWSMRPDPFSTWRPGFEVRTYRRCGRVLVFHSFPELDAEPVLVRSVELDYADLDYGSPVSVDAQLAHEGSSRFRSVIRSVTECGFVLDPAIPRSTQDGVTFLTYIGRFLPPLELEYSSAAIDDAIRTVDPESAENLPHVDGKTYQFVDLDGEGIAGILTEQGNTWFYKPNLGEGTFGALQPVDPRPSTANLAGGRQQLLDLAGDGQLDLVAYGGESPGFYERTDQRAWESFRPFGHVPNIPWDDPNLRWIDLNGDGHADLLLAEDEVFTWYPSLAEEGFGASRRAPSAVDDEQGPRLVREEETQAIYLADMNGDGLTDIVRIRNGEVCYWPNCGYGRFAAKVTMDDPPVFDPPDLFDRRRIHLADIDGSGTTDILYLRAGGASLYFNQSGNRWTGPRRLPELPPSSAVTSVMTADLMGNGTTCLVWSSPLPHHERSPLRFIDLMGGRKPHLLTRWLNNLGAETRIRYVSSTRFYLADRRAGRPWITRLPFPVHVVERVETYDHVSRNRFVTRYSYHHGYFDGAEREFRGFALVQQIDTEELSAHSAGRDVPAGDNFDEASYVPPVVKKTWYHTGAWAAGERISRSFEADYYEDPEGRLLPDTILDAGWSVEEQRQAARALKGSLLRQEIYAADGTALAGVPYLVTETNYTVVRLQAEADHSCPVYHVHPRESIQLHYEREPANARASHSLTLETDSFGNVLRSANVAYGRAAPDTSLDVSIRDVQQTPLMTWTSNRFTAAIDAAPSYRVPLPCETATFEVTGVTPKQGAWFTFDELTDDGFSFFTSLENLEFENDPNPAKKQRRIVQHERTLYRADDLSSPLPLGHSGLRALPFDSYRLSLTPGLIADLALRMPAFDAVLRSEGGYVAGSAMAAAALFPNDLSGFWWIRTGEIYHSPESTDLPPQELAHAIQHFFLPHRWRDPFGNTTTLIYEHDLLTLEIRDPAGSTITAGQRDAAGNIVVRGNDLRVLKPFLLTDPNGNRSAASFDAHGRVTGTALMGKATENLGDSLAGFVADWTDATIFAQLADPLLDPHAVLADATTCVLYDSFAYARTRASASPSPSAVMTIVRETHRSDLAAGVKTAVQHNLLYSDGFGRELQKKSRAEPGPLQPNGPVASRRWIASGWTIFNNKGKPVRQYEPFFTAGHEFERDFKAGVSPIVFYDPLERPVATLRPNHTFEKVVFDPWRQATYDVNDTVTELPSADPDVGVFFERLESSEYLPTWYEQRENGALGSAEKKAADRAAAHHDTPTIAHYDPLGRPFADAAHNGFDENGTAIQHLTRRRLDIEGNEREVIDAESRTAMRYRHDLSGNRIHQSSIDGGERWILRDAAGKPLYEWDSLGRQRHTVYDELRRPAELRLRSGTGEITVTRSVFGKTAALEATNRRGRVTHTHDGAGVVTHEEYDFKGNLTHSRRQLAAAYRAEADWSGPVALETVSYATRSRFDALNRPTAIVTPDDTTIRPSYNIAGLLHRIAANVRGDSTATVLVDDVQYDARGQRTRLTHGNGVTTRFRYDDFTFRLTGIVTRRGAAFTDDCPDPAIAPCGVQNLHYTYDPVGNIVAIGDAAQPTVFFDGVAVAAGAEYQYDPLYRLIAAKGREHRGMTGSPHATWDDAGRTALSHPHDHNALRVYTETYGYDRVGNILKIAHDAVGGQWTRLYDYEDISPFDAAFRSNRLTRTRVGGAVVDQYGHDGNGSMTAMAHLQVMGWDYRDRLRRTARQAAVGGATPESTWYAYDAEGARVRKVTDRAAAAGSEPTRKTERIYLDGWEVFRRYEADGTTIALERETLHISDEGSNLALLETRTRGNDGSPSQLVRYQYTDHLGSVALELGANAEVLSYEEYYPYGSTSYQGVSAAGLPAKRHRYIGRERDEESGLAHHGLRYYAPWLGRWTQCDPLWLRDSTNVYAYALARPIVAKDPAGGPVWLIPVAIYLGWRALESAAETGVEAGIAKATGDESFSTGGTFLKNMAVNTVIGVVPGAPEAKIGTKVAIYTAKVAVRTTADATYDTMQGKGSFTDNLQKNAVANVGGDVVGTGIKKVVQKTGLGDKLADAATKAKGYTSKSVFAKFGKATTIATKGIDEQAEFLAKNIPGLSKEQARDILQEGFKRNSSVVFGGSRVRGDFTPGSDIDVGWGNMSKSQAQDVIKKLNRQYDLKLEKLEIVKGRKTDTIDPITTPEEFFQRSGIRAGGDLKAGQPYAASGSVTVLPSGEIILAPPGTKP
jgi:RHS repeat-associated protein